MSFPDLDHTLTALITAAREAARPETWSKAVKLTRLAQFHLVSKSSSEIVLKIIEPGRPVGTKVVLYLDDLDWSCDSTSPEDPSEYVAAAIISLKSGVGLEVNDGESASGSGEYLKYALNTTASGLNLERYLISANKQTQLGGSLIEFCGGIKSGRLTGTKFVPAQEDFAIDAALSSRRQEIIDSEAIPKLFRALSQVTSVELDGVEVSVSSEKVLPITELKEERNGYRLRSYYPATVSKVFANGALLQSGVLYPAPGLNVSAAVAKLVMGEGSFFSREQVTELCSEIIPLVSDQLQLVISCESLPSTCELEPHVVLDTKSHGESMSVTARMFYGDPPLAEVSGASLIDLHTGIIPIRNQAAEKKLSLALQQQLNLQPGRAVEFYGAEAVDKLSQFTNWRIRGDATRKFSRAGKLEARLTVELDSISLNFSVSENVPLGLAEQDGAGEMNLEADPNRVLKAWQVGEQLVPLLSGGWAEIPRDWLNKHGERIIELLSAQKDNQKLPPALTLVAANLAQELQQPVSEQLQEFKLSVENIELLPKVELPEGLTAELRDYQRLGFNWLSQLKHNQLGAILADDMGLGKTLQAICCISGRTLVVAPTSVIHSWSQQLQQFRPSLKVNIFHGSKRELDDKADLTITSYAVLRMEIKSLSEIEWQMVVLDESQVIKNPESQTAQAVFNLKANFRLALSGTPVENRLDDLWSQFNFTNPGLLGTQAWFREVFARPIGRGDKQTLAMLRSRVAPLILRRLKEDVAKELPEKIETVLSCELDQEERITYDALYLATKEEVIKKLAQGGSVIGALEALLRVRQACCHQALLPGREHCRNQASSKVQLLVEELEKSISNGHRSLVFSQWTSFLDLIEPHLQLAGIEFTRLDGSTRDRQRVVDEFQNQERFSVMLISLRAGGLGLTLTAADHIYLMDSWWNPAVERQAADRAHRIGQTKPVLVTRIIVEDSIEERILELQQKKQQLAAGVLDSNAEDKIEENAGLFSQGGLSKEDLLGLVS